MSAYRPRNECGACGLDFTSLMGFDAHRVGKHAYTFKEGLEQRPPREDGRRCLDEDELRALQYAQDGMGRWQHGPSAARARTTFARPHTGH